MKSVCIVPLWLMIIVQLVGLACSFALLPSHGSGASPTDHTRTVACRAVKVDLSLRRLWGDSHGNNNKQQQQQQGVATSSVHHFLEYLNEKERVLSKRLHQVRGRVVAYQTSLAALRAQKASLVSSSKSKKKQQQQVPLFRETPLRSMVKSLAWRMIAGWVTFTTTMRFSRSVAAACQVVSADFLSKAFTMFVAERLMNQSSAGRCQGADTASRSLVKALVWRAFAIANTLTMALFVAKDMSVASKIASTDAVVKTTLMFLYERLWARVPWGKEYYYLDRIQQQVTTAVEPAVKQKPTSKHNYFLFYKPIYMANATALDMAGGMAI